MKYIDAEKLIAEIEKMREINKKAFMAEHITAEQAINRLFEFITSLQQEQPEGLHFTPLNRLIQKIPSEKWNDSTNNYAKKLRDCLIKEGYLKDAEVLQGYISYMNGNNVPMATMDEQEQPKVDLVAELKHYLATTPKEQLDKKWKELEHWNNVGPTVQEFLYGKQSEVDLEKEIASICETYGITKYLDAELGPHDIKNIAHHFYELGLNARKEK